MRIHLLTIQGIKRVGENWRLAPLVPLRHLREQGRATLMLMPMPGEDVELLPPGGQVVMARIVSFGVDAWKDAQGNLIITTDPNDPEVALIITGSADVGVAPPGTEVWFTARFRSAPEAG